MRPTVVVDVGNTRIKWGLCQDGQVAQVSSLPPDDSTLWAEQAAHWQLTPGCVWVLTGVVPARCDALADWLRQQGYEVHLLLKAADLPLKVDLARPDHVGIDRLLDAVAANSRRPPGVAAILIDAGSAVTMDLVDSDGVFRGGAILPGLRLMINALHDYTALLPLIDIPRQTPVVPGVSTPLAMEVGVFWAVAGGLQALLNAYRQHLGTEPMVFFTGGDTPALAPMLPTAIPWPTMTLEGVRLSAEARS